MAETEKTETLLKLNNNGKTARNNNKAILYRNVNVLQSFDTFRIEKDFPKSV